MGEVNVIAHAPGAVATSERTKALARVMSVAVALLVAACGRQGPETETAPPSGPGSRAEVAAPSDTGTRAEPVRVESEIASETPARSPKIAAIVVNHAVGRSPAELGRIFAPAQDRVTECAKAGTGGTLLVDVNRAATGSTKLSVRPGASIGPNERRCVLEALSTMEIDDEVNQNRNPGPTPLSGFSSVVTVTW